jgi:glycosyltransferase involved in cell wall biosynthesis
MLKHIATHSPLLETVVVKVSVIVPAFNEERLLGETLGHINRSIPALTRRGWEAELIVCDNNSTDATATIAREAGALVVFEPINQIARARNRGAEAATGDWLIFVDADSHPSAELFSDVADKMASGKYMAGGVTIRLEAGYPKAALLTSLWNWASRVRRLVAGSFIFCETDAFRSLGGFSDKLFAAEEIELSARLKKLARQRKQKVVILHKHPIFTSARKMRLYKTSELWRFFLRAALNQKKMLTNREACHPWYDGRR